MKQGPVMSKSAPYQSPTKTQSKNGHQIAHAWWIGFNRGLGQANGYLIDSKLLEAFHNTPLDQHDAFLESIGGYFVVNATSGYPASHLEIDSEEIKLQKLSPAEQDAHFEKMEASND